MAWVWVFGDERSNTAPDMPATPDLLSALLSDTSPTLDDKLRREYQVLLGKCSWLCKVLSEIEHPMALLSAYASRPTQLCYRRLCQLVGHTDSWFDLRWTPARHNRILRCGPQREP